MKFSKLAVILALAVLVFPVAAMADNTISWVNASGTLSASSTGMSISSSVVGVVWPNGMTSYGNMGTLTLTTGSLLSGSLTTGCMGAGGCTFSATGSSFAIAGSKGAPSFTGDFTTNVTLIGTMTSTGKYSYTISGGVLMGSINGSMMTTTGGTTQLVANLSHPFTGGMVHLAGGATNVTVPEPGTLGLLGTGLFGLAGVLRRKLVHS